MWLLSFTYFLVVWINLSSWINKNHGNIYFCWQNISSDKISSTYVYVNCVFGIIQIYKYLINVHVYKIFFQKTLISQARNRLATISSVKITFFMISTMSIIHVPNISLYFWQGGWAKEIKKKHIFYSCIYAEKVNDCWINSMNAQMGGNYCTF